MEIAAGGKVQGKYYGVFAGSEGEPFSLPGEQLEIWADHLLKCRQD